MEISAWDSFVSQLITTYKLQKCLPRKFCSELDFIKRLAAQPKLCESLRSWLLALPDVRPQGELKSNQYRERGNEIFKSKQSNHLALEVYSKAIFEAPAGTEALALAHANRAILLIRFGRYREAFQDCQLALASGYPEQNRSKVLLRQAECAQHLQDALAIRQTVNGFVALSSQRSLSRLEQEKLHSLQAMLEQRNDKASYEGSGSSAEDEIPLPRLKEVTRTKVGRYMVTEDNIQTDGLISREKAVSFVPVYGVHHRTTIPAFDCQQCARVNVIPFPCYTCGRACYCSTNCREKHEPVHRYECYGYRKHLWYLIGIAHLGIRSFLDGTSTIVSAVNCETKDATNLFQELLDGTQHEDNRFLEYGRVFRLVTNFDRMEPEDVLQYALTGLMLAIYLENCTDFFTTGPLHSILPKDQLLLFTGALIIRHIGQLICNGHAISELQATLPSVASCLEEDGFRLKPGLLHRYYSSERVFTAIFPRISMFNHSCDPNIRNCFEGSTLTVYATRPIRTGGEIFNCYGPNYKLMPASERSMCLRRQYCFDCSCDRCAAGNDTPYEECYLVRCPASSCAAHFSLEMDCKLCSDGGFKCPACGHTIDCSWFQTIMDITETNSDYTNDLFRTCAKAYEKGEKLLVGNNQNKSLLLRLIIDRFLPTAAMDAACLVRLKTMARELVSIQGYLFGRMTPEYIVAWFYLADLLALEHCISDGSVATDGGLRKMLADFRKSLEIIGADNRAIILHYLDSYVKLA
ncbi:SET and MYND domain-containing protein 4-like [Anopheles aquasalis]|uniref:SET and MYND domain-containing protein 4-like n=1 Tax=Anopheles aquasalis TaxID=42839 RepID=UPI00215AFA0A|nr:SET and MYND domain-containing protein 4-like [Anopheles aquasalis]